MRFALEGANTKKRIRGGVGTSSTGGKKCRGPDPPPPSEGTTGGRCDERVTGDGDESDLGSDGEPESNPADFEHAGGSMMPLSDWKQFLTKLLKIPEAWGKAAYRQVWDMGTAISEKVRDAY